MGEYQRDLQPRRKAAGRKAESSQFMASHQGLWMDVDGSCGQESHQPVKKQECANHNYFKKVTVDTAWDSGQALGDQEQVTQLGCQIGQVQHSS